MSLLLTHRTQILVYLDGLEGTLTEREIADALDLPCKVVQDALDALLRLERVSRSRRKFHHAGARLPVPLPTAWQALSSAWFGQTKDKFCRTEVAPHIQVHFIAGTNRCGELGAAPAPEIYVAGGTWASWTDWQMPSANGIRHQKKTNRWNAFGKLSWQLNKGCGMHPRYTH